MPLYMCHQCGSVENTAAGEFWRQEMEAIEKETSFEPKCSACVTGQWHGAFPRRSAAGYVADQRGRFIYAPEEAEGYFKHLGPFQPVRLPETAKSGD